MRKSLFPPFFLYSFFLKVFLFWFSVFFLFSFFLLIWVAIFSLTHLMGFATRQFGNLLMLQAAYQSPALRPMVPGEVLANLIAKTIHWFRTLMPISPALRRDCQILENAAAKLDFPLC